MKKSILKTTAAAKKKPVVQVLDDDEEEMDCDISKRKPRAAPVEDKSNGTEKVKKTTEKCIEDFEDLELDSDTDAADNEEEAEKQEEEMITMPQLNTVLAELHAIKSGRRIVVNPLKINDMMNPKFIQLIKDDACEEIRLHFVRSKNKDDDWAGFLIMNFASMHTAEQAAEMFSEINPELAVKTKENSKYASTNMEKWVKEERTSKRWSDTLLYIKNIAPSVTKEQLEELFPDADDIILRSSRIKKGEETPREGYAMFRTLELAQAAARDYADKVIEIDGHQLKIYKYHVPPQTPLRGLLKLKERRAVLRYMDRLQIAVDSEKEAIGDPQPEWCKKRLESCKRVIEADDKARSIAGLSLLSLEELRLVHGVKVLKGEERQDLLVKLGIIVKPRTGLATKDREFLKKKDDSTDRKRKYNDRSNSTSLLGNPPSLISMNPSGSPVPLLSCSPWNMMGMSGQGMGAGLMGAGGMGAGLMGAGGMGARGMGGMGGSLMGAGFGGMMSSFGSMDSGGSSSSNKILRLDASGSYHVDTSRRDNRGGRGGKSGNSKPRSLLDL